MLELLKLQVTELAEKAFFFLSLNVQNKHRINYVVFVLSCAVCHRSCCRR